MPPSATPAPRSLNLWLTHLQPQQPPVDPAVRDALLEALAAGSGSAAHFAGLLQRDPPQALILLREANRALAKYGRDAGSLEHAITLLGTLRMRKLLLAAPALDPAHPGAVDYRQALLRSQHAAWQARLWAEGSGRWHPEEIYWATLLAGAPLWLLWLEAGPLLRQLLIRRAEGRDAGGGAQKRILGSALAPLCAALAKAWQLPEVSRERWRPESAGTPRQWLELARAARLEEPPVVPVGPVNDLSHQPALVAAVANALADETDWDWQSQRTLRLFRIAASLCRRPLSTLLSHGHQTAAALSRAHTEHGASDLLSPAARLLCHWREAALLAPVPAAKAPPPPAPDNRALAGALQRLRQPERLHTPREALALAPAALVEGVGFSRAVVLRYRPATRELQTLFSAGCETSPALLGFRYPAAQSALLSQLLQKPACLALGPDNRARYLPHLPAPLRSAVGTEVEQLLLMSVFAGQTPLALVYADNGGAAIDAARQQGFRQFCQQLSTALGQLLRRQGGGG